MRLTGKEIGKLRDAILDAYTDLEELRMDILVGMDINLTHIVSGSTYQTRVFTLIERFQSEERLEEFVDILVEKRPRNSTLKQYQQLMQNVQSEADLVKIQVKEENRQTKQIVQIIKESEPEIRNYPELIEVPEQVTDVVPSDVLPVTPQEDSRNSLSTLELETVYVDSRGQITTKKDVSVSYYDQPIPNNEDPICMVSIPQGEFWMGSPESEKGRYSYESPQHFVKVPAFFMSQTPITQAQWKAIASLPEERKRLEPDPSRFKGDNLPVERVTWQDAIEFCARLSRLTGRNYRLPSEAEWEYACRAIPNPIAKKSNQKPVYLPFHFGETLTSDLANYDATEIYQQEAKGEFRGKTTPIRKFPSNVFGLYDMHGNVREWCLDPWHDNYKGAPGDGKVWDKEDNNNRYQDILSNINVLIEDDGIHVLRGGAWSFVPRSCRSACRDYYVSNYDYVGFRLALSL